MKLTLSVHVRIQLWTPLAAPSLCFYSGHRHMQYALNFSTTELQSYTALTHASTDLGGTSHPTKGGANMLGGTELRGTACSRAQEISRPTHPGRR
jgi:hypothetical protein